MRTQPSLLVEDLEKSDMAPRMPNWLKTEGFHSHAEVPLVAQGRSIGVLEIDARRPRLLDLSDLRLLHLMANQASIAIEKARMHREVRGQALEKELELGRQIQLSPLPEASPVVPGWEFAVYYQAAHLVGGDFYDFFEFPGPPDRLGLVVADVMGKGVPAALFLAISRTIIRATAMDSRSHSTALGQAKRVISKDSRSDLFLTAFYARLDTGNGRLGYANGVHNRPFWWRAATRRVGELAARGIIMGALGEIELEEREIEVAPGDLIVLCTDGLTEAVDAENRPFGLERLRAAVATNTDTGAQQALESIVDAVQAFTGGAPQSDNMTVLVFRRCA